jgi:hypothetical protein
MKIRKTVTPAKAAANKKNSEKSTGPTSIQGKARASQNAISLGMFTRDMLLPGESEKEWKQLRSKLTSNYCPDDFRAVRRIEKLTWNEWRLRRLRRGEAGEIAKLLADHETRAEIAASTHIPQYNQAVADLAQLTQIEEQINSEGRVSTENLDWLRNLPCSGDEGKNLCDVIELAQAARPKEGARPSPDIPAAGASRPPKRAKNAATSEGEWEVVRPLLLSILDSLKESMRAEQLHHGEYLIRRAEAQRNTLLVPQEAVLNRIMRCESHILSNIET